ncbi:EF-hand domain-containing protein [Aurantibacter sp.]|uniref:EF-hand domain-containing protein n=1 Tax=Aurantibacter sp. TaxID=2807103 RepID=UPI0035C7B2A4
MTSKILKLSVLTIALCSFTFTSAQEKEKRNPEKVFKKLDTNGDNFISMEEFKAPREKSKGKIEAKFKEIDTNNNGSISINELQAVKREKTSSPENLAKRFAKMDVDNSSALSMEEFKKALIKMRKRKTRRDSTKE